MKILQYKINKGSGNTSLVFLTVCRGYNKFISTTTGPNIFENTKSIIPPYIRCADSQSSDGISYPIDRINKEEKMYRRLLVEKQELQRKKSNIENRLIEIQNDLDIRREEIRSGDVRDKR